MSRESETVPERGGGWLKATEGESEQERARKEGRKRESAPNVQVESRFTPRTHRRILAIKHERQYLQETATTMQQFSKKKITTHHHASEATQPTYIFSVRSALQPTSMVQCAGCVAYPFLRHPAVVLKKGGFSRFSMLPMRHCHGNPCWNVIIKVILQRLVRKRAASAFRHR